MAASIFNEVLPNLPQFNPKDYVGIEIGYDSDEFQIESELFDSGEAIPLPKDDEFDPESQPANEEDMGAAEGGVRTAGIEILAFYKSYRHINNPPFRGKWGIFYVNSGVQHISRMLAIEFPGAKNLRGVCLEIRKNIDPNKSLSRPAHNIGIPGVADFFFQFMKNQPEAYARFDENIFELKSETAAGIFKGQRSKYARANELALWVALHPPSYCGHSNIPEHLVLGINYSKIISPARFIPLVKKINETPKFISDIPPGHQSFWEKTKSKLIKSSCLPGLDFKYFEPLNLWSARVNDNFRAHFSPISIQQGVWEAVSYGSHKKMGHG